MGKTRWNRKCARESSLDDYFYSLPSSKLLTVILVVTIAIVVIFFCIFKYVTRNWCGINSEANTTVGTYLSLIGVPIGIILSFIVATAWGFYADAQVKQTEEARSLLLLYDIVDSMSVPGTREILDDIEEYTQGIIENEFPLMQRGESSQEGLEQLLAIGKAIMALDPETNADSTLYGEAIDVYKRLVDDRVVRYGYVVYGLQPELWWVLVLGVVLIVFLSFFLYCESKTMHCIGVCVAAVGLSSLLFLAVSLNYPYRGDFGIDSTQYQLVLSKMQDEYREKYNTRSTRSSRR